MAILNGFTKDTAKNLQLDAGVLVVGLASPENFAGELGSARKVGATSGGGNFIVETEIRNLFEDLDGARGNYKDGNVIDSCEIKLSVTIKEMTVENIKMALGAADTATKQGTNQKYDITTARMTIKPTDYMDNICWLGTINGSDVPMIIELRNVMNSNGLNFSFEDKGKGGIELELKAHFTLEKPDEVPFKIYTPTAQNEVLSLED